MLLHVVAGSWVWGFQAKLKKKPHNTEQFKVNGHSLRGIYIERGKVNYLLSVHKP